MINTVDFVVIGSGIAGLTTALTLASFGDVLIITKKSIAESSTKYAQGGIAAVMSKKDSFDSHMKDTMIAGSNHNNKQAVSFLVKNGPAAINKLITYGVPFDKDSFGN